MGWMDDEQPWREQAACRQPGSGGVQLFFPAERARPNTGRPGRVTGDEEKRRRAKAVCRLCPVVEACLEHALTAPEDYGIWGATTSEERDAMRRERRRKQR